MIRHRGPPSQGWSTFLRNHAAQIAAIDLFVVPTINFKLLFGLVILRDTNSSGPTSRHTQPPSGLPARSRRRSLGIKRRVTWSVTATLASLSHQASTASHGHPRSAHHASLTMAKWSCRTFDRIDSTRMPRPCRRIGRKAPSPLANYAAYYNAARTHLALDKDAPLNRPTQFVGRIASVAWLGGLHLLSVVEVTPGVLAARARGPAATAATAMPPVRAVRLFM
jgi:hypothetical protein